jgi:hypothetical protein
MRSGTHPKAFGFIAEVPDEIPCAIRIVISFAPPRLTNFSLTHPRRARLPKNVSINEQATTGAEAQTDSTCPYAALEGPLFHRSARICIFSATLLLAPWAAFFHRVAAVLAWTNGPGCARRTAEGGCPHIKPAASEPVASAQVSAGQVHDAFQVVGLGKQIDQVHLLDTITGGEQGHEIAGQRGRIARYINNPWRAQGS